jgi:ribosomal protein S18 acetylase RimI-like enzyme
MTSVRIQKAASSELETLMNWRMEVLHEVFSIPADADTSALEDANRRYYGSALVDGSHIACFAFLDNEIVGCGGVCLQREMPSPDNPNGLCGYLMNIYVRPAYRQIGIGEEIVKWLVCQARERLVTKIYLEASDSGQSLYQDLGFKRMENYMKL